MSTLLALLLAAGLVMQANDLDQFMEQVLVQRDQNWKKLQQYVLEEREAFEVTGPGGTPLYGLRRDYAWFIRDDIFVRSPTTVDGVKLSEADRRKAEAEFIAEERRRAERGRGAGPGDPVSAAAGPSTDAAPPLSAVASAATLEPGFVSAAYFLRFKFEPGHYALAGRESLEGRAVLRIEYYPEALFREGRTRPNRRARERDGNIEAKMNKVSLITLWIDPETHQILQYTFDDIDMDFMPGRSLVRLDDLKATMRMGQAFPGVWLPKDIDMRFRMTLAVGAVAASYRVEYHDYREAAVSSQILPPER